MAQRSLPQRGATYQKAGIVIGCTTISKLKASAPFGKAQAKSLSFNQETGKTEEKEGRTSVIFSATRF